MGTIIVAGHLVVDPDARARYLAGCAGAVRAARATSGCPDFALGADLVDPARVTCSNGGRRARR